MKAEDLQPNETLKKNKGESVIPAIRQSQPLKYQSSSRRIHRNGTPRHGHRQHQSLVQPRGGGPTRKVTENQYDRKRITGRPRSHGSGALSPDRTPRDETKHHGPAHTPARYTLSLSYDTSSSLFARQDSQLHPHCLNQTLAHDAGDLQAPKRRTREWETTVNRSQKRWKTRTGRQLDELKLDLPPECRKNAVGRSHNKILFLNKLRDGLRENMGAEIVHNQFTDTQLIVTYFTPGILEDDEYRRRLPATRAPPILDRPPSGSNSKVEGQEAERSSTFGIAGETYRTSSTNELAQTPLVNIERVERIVVSTPSGSNVKLDDLYRSVTSLINIKEDIRSPLFTAKQVPLLQDSCSNLCDNSVNEGVTTPRQISSRPRHFRSGIAVLHHGPSKLSARTVAMPEENISVSPHNVDVHDPPLHTREGAVLPSSRKAEPQVAGAAPFVPLNHPGNAEDPSEIEQSGSPARSRVCLDEETSTTVQIPKANGDKQRRILVSNAQDGVYCVTMHGFVHHVGLKSRSHRKELYTHPDSDKVFIEDICLFAQPFDNIAVVGQAHEENALSLLNLSSDDNGSRVVRVARTSLDLERQRRGVSAVTTLPTSGSSLSFVSAGYDHAMHLWSLDPDPSATFEQPPVAGFLDVHHTSLVQSLLSVGNRLVSGGADNSVRTWDLQAAQAVSTIRTSNSVYQLHRTENPDVVLTEVGHRDLQFELHDCRLSAECRPPLRFGYPSSQGANGRYVRGAVDPGAWNTFVSGGRDGVIRLWDLRNTNECKQEVMCFPGQKVVHAAFASDNLIVTSDDNRLSFFDFAHL